MNITEIIKKSFKYPTTSWKKLFIYGILIVLANLVIITKPLVPHNAIVAAIAGIIALIFAFVIAGFEIDIIKEGINQTNEIPVFDFVSQFVKGIKSVITSIVYFIIPAIIVLVVGLVMQIPQEGVKLISAMQTSMVDVNGTTAANMTAAAVPNANAFLAHVGILAIIALILFIIFAIFFAIGKCRLAKDDSLASAINIPEVFNDLKAIGVGKFIGTVIVMAIVIIILGIVFAFILGIIGAIIGMIVPALGYLFLTLVGYIFITPYLNLFEGQVLGLLYSEK